MNTDLMIDRDTVVAAATKLVEANPERTNGGMCSYTNHLGDSPNCIAGALMVELDLADVEELSAWDGYGESNFHNVFEMGNLPLAPEAADFIDALQAYADNRWIVGFNNSHSLVEDFGSGDVPWPVALEKALANNDPSAVKVRR